MPEFRSLASMLRPIEPARSLTTETFPKPQPLDPETTIEEESIANEIGRLLRDVHLFKAAVAEGVESAVREICGDIAAQVLARELRIAPAAIDAIVQRLLERFIGEEPLRVRVNPAEAASVTCGIPVAGDESLLPGDAVLELRSGAIEATLGMRLQAILTGSR